MVAVMPTGKYADPPPGPGHVGQFPDCASAGPAPPCPRATPALAASAATEARNPFLIERSLSWRGCLGPGGRVPEPRTGAPCRRSLHADAGIIGTAGPVA